MNTNEIFYLIDESIRELSNLQTKFLQLKQEVANQALATIETKFYSGKLDPNLSNIMPVYNGNGKNQETSEKELPF